MSSECIFLALVLYLTYMLQINEHKIFDMKNLTYNHLAALVPLAFIVYAIYMLIVSAS